MHGDSQVLYAVEGGVAWLTLNEPPANCYSHALMRALDDAILAARFDDDVHVIVLTGAGEKFFCAGADIQMLQDVTPTFKYQFCLHANETLRRLEETPKLVIAAINGHCVGGGLEIALAADLRVSRAGEHKLGLPEVHLGVLPGTGGTQRLARALGRSAAIEMMATGRNLSVQEALEAGLINTLLPDGDFRAAVQTHAQTFCPPQKASMAVGRIKRAVQTGLELELGAGLALERELQQQLFMSEDAAEGLAAFSEKRKPVFKGR
jgi:enoyl-CoA hydratase/carnithine racemase